MVLKPGTWLGHYEVLDHIGSGGMGEVYRARDNKLQREVALKLLPKAFAQDPERVARFRREAQVLAQLNHVNIAAIYSVEQTRVEQTGDTHFLVMELVPGETLRDRIQRWSAAPKGRQNVAHGVSRGAEAGAETSPVGATDSGPIPLDEALDIAKQIAAGLACAHEKPIVHRDLKPANIKVTPSGVVKILDFGLARAFAPDTGSADPANSPTLTGMTEPGVILGTAAYMSPEQARGKTVDKRSDIWAFGCVLYEMLTGKWVFDYQSRDREGAGVPLQADGKPPVAYAPGSDSESETVADILGAVIHKDPDWSALPASTPPNVRFVLRRCLEKDAKRRFHSATDVAIALEEPWSVAASEAAPATAIPVRPSWQRALPTVLAGLVAAVIVGVAVWTLKPAPPQPVSRTIISLPANEQLAAFYPALALSPDGTQLVYVSRRGSTQQQLYLRAMDSLDVRPIPGTEDAFGPFFSPDGQWIGFFACGKLKKISVSGGAALTLCDAANPRGGSWGPNDTIAFTPTIAGGLSQVSAAGGEPQALTKQKAGEVSHRWPQFLPDGKSVLFTVQTGNSPDDWSIAVQRFDTAEPQILIRGGTYAQYVPSGHLVYYRAGTLMAVPFDPERLEIRGTPVPVVEGILSSTALTGAAQFSFSTRGSLVYVPGGTEDARLRSLVWVDRRGTEEPIPAPPRPYLRPRLSPDGQRLAIEISGEKTDIWIYDLPRKTLTPLTFEGDKIQAGWTPDGKRVLYSTRTHLYWKPFDGSGAEELLAENAQGFSAPSVTPDGKLVAYSAILSNTNRDIWALPLEGDPSAALRTGPSAGSGQVPRQAGTEGRKARVLIQTPSSEGGPMFSPDGRWLAYASDESGRTEVYVRSFPSLEGKWRISTEGSGGGPRWNPNGRELFYRSGGKMMAVDVTTQPTFSPGRPRALFDDNPYDPDPAGGYRPNYDVSPDGQRFLMLKPVEQQQTALTQINVVLNWFEELQRRVPVP